MLANSRWLLATLGLALAGPALGDEEPAQELELACLIEPQLVVRLATAVEGQVIAVLVNRGDAVSRGQIVAKLESSVERAAAAMAKAEAQAEQRREGRQVRMFSKAVISKQQLEDVRTRRKLAELKHEHARAMLGQRIIRSPIDGVVTRRLLDPGEYAEPSDLLEIAQIDPLRVEALAPAAAFGRVLVGMTAWVTSDEASTDPVEARVTVVDPVVDAGSGSFGIQLELPNTAQRIPAGVSCRVRFDFR